MINTFYGGPIEYFAAALVVVQIMMARPYLRRRRAIWPRTLYIAVVTMLLLLWSTTIVAIWLVLSGTMYTSRVVPVGLGTAMGAVGFFWIMLSSLAIAIRLAARFILVRIPGPHLASRRKWIRTAGLAAVSAPVAIAAFGALVERNRYRIRELDFPIEGLHPDLEGFRIVQVTDLHVSPFLSPREAGRVIDMANELHGDLALFTGDLISELGDPLDEAIRELVRLRGDAGVLGCMGNHEEYVRCRNYMERQTRRSGLIFLRNTSTQIRRGEGALNIVGVDYQRKLASKKYLIGTEQLLVPGVPNLLLSHNPDVFPTAIQRGFQAVLSGHTHGGQVNVEILHQNVNPARFRTPFVSGLYRMNGAGAAPASCFVSNGVGTIGMPIRLGAPPEIALLRLRRA